MSILLIVLLVILLAGGGGYYGYNRWGFAGSGGILGLIIVIVLICFLFGGLRIPR